MTRFRQSEYVPAVSKTYHRELASRSEAELFRAADESLRAMRGISGKLLQKAVQDLVNEQANALRHDPSF